VFENAIPEFFLAHFDLTGNTGNIMTAVGPSGLPILIDAFVRITRSPVASMMRRNKCGDCLRQAELQSTQAIFGGTVRSSTALEKMANALERGLGTAGRFELDLGRQIADL
jgi:hypothetical protein